MHGAKRNKNTEETLATWTDLPPGPSLVVGLLPPGHPSFAESHLRPVHPVAGRTLSLGIIGSQSSPDRAPGRHQLGTKRR